MTAEKTSKPAITQHQQAGGAFFRKAAEEGFFGQQQPTAFFGQAIQPKLSVSQPGDPQEQEADAVADQVMRMPGPAAFDAVQRQDETGDGALMRSPSAAETPIATSNDELNRKEEEQEESSVQPLLMRKCAECEKEDQVQTRLMRMSDESVEDLSPAASVMNLALGDHQLHPKAHGPPADNLIQRSGRAPPATDQTFESTLQSSKGGGAPLPGDTRQSLESRFGADFSNVRIHTGTQAESLSAGIHAQAFTHGGDIYFNSGKFSPNTAEGGHLLAHELTHTIQQGASKSTAPSSHNNTTVAAKRKLQRQQNANSSAPLNKKVEEGGEELQQEEHNIQPKAELSNWSVDASGHLQPGPASTAIQEDKAQAKDENEEEDKQETSLQPLVQKKKEHGFDSKQGCYDQNSLDIQPKHTLQLQTRHIDCSVNGHTGAERPEMVSEQGRGPPSLTTNDGQTVHRSPIDDALAFAGSVTDCITIDLDEAKRCALQKAQQVALHIQGYRALRVVLGEDPITGERIDRDGYAFIEAAFDIMPGGMLLHQKLNELHQLDAAADWIDGRIVAIEALISGLTDAFTSFWNGLGVTDLSSPMDVLRQGLDIVLGFINQVIQFAIDAATGLLEMVKDFLLTQVVDFIREQTPAYPLLTVILGKDPVTGAEVERNGTNILNALLELGGEEGVLQRTQMEETGTFQKVAGYIDEGIAVFDGAYEQIVLGFRTIWDTVSIESLIDPIGTFLLIYNQFAEPVSRVWAFVSEVGGVILQFIKEVLLVQLSAYAQTIRGYRVLTLVIGQDPFTGEEVPFTVENVIHAFMSLMDGGEEQFNQMKQTGAIARATRDITAALAKLNMTPAAIIQLYIDFWTSFSLQDLADPIGAFQRILGTFGEPILRLIAFVAEIVRIVIYVILQIMNFPFDVINNIISRSMEAFGRIKKDPIGFLKNLLRAIKQGFIQFFDNIATHLLNGLTGWLLGELRDANVQAPTDFTLRGIIGWVLEILGISMEKIWEKLAAHPRIGPERVAQIRRVIDKLEGIWTFIKDVQERGIVAIWEKIQEQLSNLWTVVLEAITKWVMEKIIINVTIYLLGLLDPTFIMSIVNSVIFLYRAVNSFIRYASQMLQIVNSFVNGVADIAAGNIATAANYLENTMDRSMPIVIGFLADLVGLGGAGRKIAEMIESVREMVDNALTWLVNKAVDTGFALIEKVLAAGSSAIAGIKKFLGLDKPFTATDGSTHHIYYDESGSKPQLMVASGTPVAVDNLLARVQPQVATSTDNTVKTAYTDAIQHNENIKTYEAQLNGMPETPSPARQTVYNNVSSAMQALTPDLAKLMVVTPGATPPEAILPPFTMGVIASGFEALYISSTTTGGEKADKNSGATLPGWNNLLTHKDPLDPTKTIRARDNYGKMHLLHHELGGKASDSNLTPMKSSYNTDFYNDVENFAVADKPTKVMWYNVQINYHPSAGTGSNVVPGIDYSEYPSRFIGKYGYMEHNPTSNSWAKLDNGKHKKAYASPQIPVPDFSGGAREYEMNSIAEITIGSMTDGTDTMPESYAAIIATERREAHDTGRHRKYASFPDLMARLAARENIRPSGGYTVGRNILNYLKSQKKLKFN